MYLRPVCFDTRVIKGSIALPFVIGPAGGTSLCRADPENSDRPTRATAGLVPISRGSRLELPSLSAYLRLRIVFLAYCGATSSGALGTA